MKRREIVAIAFLLAFLFASGLLQSTEIFTYPKDFLEAKQKFPKGGLITIKGKLDNYVEVSLSIGQSPSSLTKHFQASILKEENIWQVIIGPFEPKEEVFLQFSFKKRLSSVERKSIVNAIKEKMSVFFKRVGGPFDSQTAFQENARKVLREIFPDFSRIVDREKNVSLLDVVMDEFLKLNYSFVNNELSLREAERDKISVLSDLKALFVAQDTTIIQSNSSLLNDREIQLFNLSLYKNIYEMSFLDKPSEDLGKVLFVEEEKELKLLLDEVARERDVLRFGEVITKSGTKMSLLAGKAGSEKLKKYNSFLKRLEEANKRIGEGSEIRRGFYSSLEGMDLVIETFTPMAVETASTKVKDLENYARFDMAAITIPVINDVKTIAGAKIYLQYVEKETADVPWNALQQRLSFFVGWGIGDLVSSSGKVKDNKLYAIGVGYRINKYFDFITGLAIFKEVITENLRSEGYFGCSIDINILSDVISMFSGITSKK